MITVNRRDVQFAAALRLLRCLFRMELPIGFDGPLGWRRFNVEFLQGDRVLFDVPPLLRSGKMGVGGIHACIRGYWGFLACGPRFRPSDRLALEIRQGIYDRDGFDVMRDSE